MSSSSVDSRDARVERAPILATPLESLEDRLWGLAMAVNPKRWRPFLSYYTNTFSVLDTKGREVIMWTGFDGSRTADTRGLRRTLCQYIAAADPSTIKRLIEENRRLRGLLSSGARALADDTGSAAGAPGSTSKPAIGIPITEQHQGVTTLRQGDSDG